jgi:hypothetical protein
VLSFNPRVNFGHVGNHRESLVEERHLSTETRFSLSSGILVPPLMPKDSAKCVLEQGESYSASFLGL